MPYIGNTPALDYISFAVQNFTVTAGTTVYTLDYSVSNENDIALYINSVAQRPGASFAYSATGTTLTLTSATLATDTMYAVFIGRAVQTVTPPASSITNTMLSPSVITGQTAVTTPATDDVLLCYDTSATALRKITFANFGNTPSFRAYLSTNMTGVALSTETKVTYQSESWDTDNAFDSTTNYRYTIPANKGGKYFFGANVTLLNSTAYKTFSVLLYKNGTEEYRGSKIVFTTDTLSSGSYSTLNLQTIIDASASDYFEIFIEIQSASGTGTLLNGTKFNNFYGFRLIGV
jgi:hypothetical protein